MTDNVTTTTPLTFEDVAQAIGDCDPGSTNASKVRALLGGRGSFATIQKHLDIIRAQRLHAAQPQAVPVPTAPPELLQLWGAAVQIATAQVRTRLDGVVQERDTLTAELQSSRGDVMAMADELESTSARLEAATTATAKAAADKLAVEQLATQERATVLELHAAETARTRGDLEAARHLEETSRMKAQLGAQALQMTIDRLTDQIGELKSLLHREASASQA